MVGLRLRWDAGSAHWWLADGSAGTLQVRGPAGQDGGSWLLPEDAMPLAGAASGRLLLCQPKRLFAGLPRQRSRRAWSLEQLAAVDPAEPRTSIHDGCADRHGNLVFGTRNDGPDGRPIGSFFQYSRRHGLRRLALPTVRAACALCLSPDGRTLYFADGAWPGLLQCDYDAERAATSHVRSFSATDEPPGQAVVDSAGQLWLLCGKQLLQLGPDGSLLGASLLRSAAPATLAFGGPGLTQLVLCSADGHWRQLDAAAPGLAEVPLDGV